jgi:PucR family transcriptional regulator, purine catabolism regulatory protein
VTETNRGEPGADGLVVRDLLAMSILERAAVLAGERGLDRPVRRLTVMTVPDILRWTKADEFMLSTGYPLPETEDELVSLVTEFAGRGVAAFGVKLGPSGRRLPAGMLAAADRLAFPIVEIPEEVAFDDILSRVFSDIVNRQAATIARAKEIHDAFLQIVLTGGQLPEIAAKLSALLSDAAVLVVDGDGREVGAVRFGPYRERLAELGLLAGHGRHPGPGVHLLDGGLTVVIAEIRAGKLRHGHLVVAGERLGPDATVAVDQAAVVAALDVTRQLAISAVERQFESNVLHDLVTGVGTDIDDALARGDAFGWDLRRRLVVVVGRGERDGDGAEAGWPEPGEGDLVPRRHIDLWCSEVRSRDRGAAAAAFATNLVAIVGAGDDPAAVPRGAWTGLRAATRHEFSMGVSRPFDEPRLIPVGYQEATKALRMGRLSHGPGTVTLFGELGLFRLLSLVEDVDELREFVRDTLGGLLDMEARERAELMRTLQALLDRHLNVAEAARALHFHYNTLRYRIAKLERLLGPFGQDPQLRLSLHLALQILRMRGE